MTGNKWESFKEQLARVLDHHIQMRVKGKDGKLGEPWMTRDVVDLIRKT